MPRSSSNKDDASSVQSAGSGSQRRTWSSDKKSKGAGKSRAAVDIEIREKAGSQRGRKEGSINSEEAASQSSVGSWMRRGARAKETRQTPRRYVEEENAGARTTFFFLKFLVK